LSGFSYNCNSKELRSTFSRLFKQLFPPRHAKTDQPGTQQQHGSGFGDWGGRYRNIVYVSHHALGQFTTRRNIVNKKGKSNGAGNCRYRIGLREHLPAKLCRRAGIQATTIKYVIKISSVRLTFE